MLGLVTDISHFGWHLRELKKPLGIEPFLLFNYQYAAIKALYKQDSNSMLLPLRLEEMPSMPIFESVFFYGSPLSSERPYASLI